MSADARVPTQAERAVAETAYRLYILEIMRSFVLKKVGRECPLTRETTWEELADQVPEPGECMEHALERYWALKDRRG